MIIYHRVGPVLVNIRSVISSTYCGRLFLCDLFYLLSHFWYITVCLVYSSVNMLFSDHCKVVIILNTSAPFLVPPP